jgi:hypothetical protein
LACVLNCGAESLIDIDNPQIPWETCFWNDIAEKVLLCRKQIAGGTICEYFLELLESVCCRISTKWKTRYRCGYVPLTIKSTRVRITG